MAKQITAEVVMRKAGQYGTRGVKDTDGKWWDFPDDKINFGQGAVISIEAASGPKKNRVGKFTVVSKGQYGGGGGSAPAGGGSSGGGRGDFSEVNWNASVARAIETLDILIKADAVALGPKTAKPADRQAVILDVLDELTARFFVDIKERKPLTKAKEVADDLGEGAAEEEGADADFDDSDDF